MVEPQIRSTTRKRRESRAKSLLRYVLGIGVLAAFFTIAHLLLYNPNDVPGTDKIDSFSAAPDQQDQDNSF